MRILTASLLIALLSFAYSNQPLASPRIGGTLRGAFSSDILNWDPALAVSSTSGAAICLIYSRLFRYREGTLTLEPELVSHWQVSPDGRRYQFALHKGVLFSDGRELTAADVVYSWERLRDPKTASPRAWLLSDVEDIRQLSRYSFEVVLQQAAESFLYFTAMPNLAVIPANHQTAATNPIGSGAWRLKEWQSDQKIVLEANKQHFRGPPYLEQLEISIIGGVPALLRYQAGQLDWVEVPPQLLGRWRRARADQLQQQAKPNVFYVGLNNRHPILGKQEVRQALNYAVCQESIVKYVLQGAGTPSYGPVPPLLGGSTVPAYTQDIAKARALLQEAGYPDGFSLELWLVNDPLLLAVAEVLVDSWTAIGIRTELVINDFSGLQQASASGEIDSFILGWSMDYPEKENFLRPLFSGGFFGAQGNRTFHSDDIFEELIAAGQWRRAEQRIIERAPWVFLWHGTETIAVQPWVRGWRMHPVFYGQDYREVWLKQPKE